MDDLPSNLIEQLRDLMPVSTMLLLKRPLTMAEAMRVSEDQARLIVRLLGSKGPSVEIERIGELDQIDFDFLPPGDLGALSGASDHVNGKWVISLNEHDDLWDARATVAHELKHILDDPFRELLYPTWQPDTQRAPAQAEAVSDHFARVALIHEPWLRHAWAQGIRDVRRLAGLFATTEDAIATRLSETGLIAPWPDAERHRYQRVKRPVVAWQDAGRYLFREPAVLAARTRDIAVRLSASGAQRLRAFELNKLTGALAGIEETLTGIEFDEQGAFPCVHRA